MTIVDSNACRIPGTMILAKEISLNKARYQVYIPGKGDYKKC